MTRRRGMGITKKPAVIVPQEHCREIMALSKAALADVAWDLAARCSESADDHPQVLATFRAVREIVLFHRSQS